MRSTVQMAGYPGTPVGDLFPPGVASAAAQRAIAEQFEVFWGLPTGQTEIILETADWPNINKSSGVKFGKTSLNYLDLWHFLSSVFGSFSRKSSETHRIGADPDKLNQVNFRSEIASGEKTNKHN